MPGEFSVDSILPILGGGGVAGAFAALLRANLLGQKNSNEANNKNAEILASALRADADADLAVARMLEAMKVELATISGRITGIEMILRITPLPPTPTPPAPPPTPTPTGVP